MRIGDIVAKRFRVEGIAGAGGMSFVYRTTDLETGEDVALKMIRRKDDLQSSLFLREAKLLMDLDHPCLARYVAHGVAETGQLYLAMEWLDGEDLKRRLDRAELSLEETLQIGTAAADALDYAHRFGAVHRDVKPENLFLVGGEASRLKLIDFGIALRSGGTDIISKDEVMGTMGYISPEQARGEDEVDGRADIFALACVLYHCVTGASPFDAEDLLACAVRLTLETPRRIDDGRDDIPKALADLVARMLEKEPNARPQHAREVSTELRKIKLGGAFSPNTTVTTHWIGARTIQDEPRRIADPPNARTRDTTKSDPPPRTQRHATETHPHRAEPEEVAPTSAPLSRPPMSEPPSSRMGITDKERRSICVILASPYESGDTGRRSWKQIERVTDSFGARMSRLRDGAILVVMPPRLSAKDQAVAAVRCAMRLQEDLGGWRFVVAMGRGLAHRGVPFAHVMERAAYALRRLEPGEIGAFGRVAPLVRSEFELGDSEMEGVAYCVVRGLARVGETSGRRCVGRERELLLMGAAFEQTASNSVARPMLVTGPAGIGKTSLIAEFLDRLGQGDAPPDVWVARADPVSAGAPFVLLKQLIRSAIKADRGATELEQRAKLLQIIESRVARTEAPRVATFLVQLLDLPTWEGDATMLSAARQNPVLMGDQIRRAVEDLAFWTTRRGPLIIVLEDLHWGDVPTVRSIEGVLRTHIARPIFVLSSGRNEVRTTFPDLWRDRSLIELEVPGLASESAEALVRSTLGEDTDASIVEQVIERADGNAFFLVELIRAVENGFDSLPETILATLESRLGELTADTRRVLRAAAVMGETFWPGAIVHLLGDTIPRTSALQQIALLIEQNLCVRRAGSQFPSEPEFAFRHALIRDVAYTTLTVEDRTVAHRLAGDWLEAEGSTDAGLLAEHFERAGESQRAVRYYHISASRALEGNDLDAVIQRGRLALSAGAQGEERAQLLLLMASAFQWLGDHREQRKCASEARELLATSRDWFYDWATTELVIAEGRLGNIDRLKEIALEILSEPIAEERLHAMLRVTTALTNRLYISGEIKEAEKTSVRMFELWDACPKTPQFALDYWHFRAIRVLYNEDPRAEIEYRKRAVSAAEAIGDLRQATFLRSVFASAYLRLGEFERAEAALRASLDTADQLGLPTVSAYCMSQLASTLLQLGKLDDALLFARASYDAYESQGNPRFMALNSTFLAQLHEKLGDLDVALEMASRAVGIQAPKIEQALSLATRANILRRLGDVDGALHDARNAVAVIDEMGTFDESESYVRLAHVEAAYAAAANAEAEDALRVAHTKLLDQLARIADPHHKTYFAEGIPENRRVMELSRERLGAGS